MGTQPKRLPSPAQQQADALADVRRITHEMRQAMTRASTRGANLDDIIRTALTELLHRGVIRVGERPNVERPMEGQTTIEEQLGG